MKLVLNPSHRELESFMLGLPEQFSSLGECIYKARNELRRFTYEGKSYVVKGYKVPLLINRIAYTFFRPGKASRAYEYAMRLRSMGIETPEPIAYIEIKRRGLLWHSFFLSDHCPYSGIMRDFEGGNIAGKEDILKAFAAFTVKLHEKGKYLLEPQELVITNIMDFNTSSITKKMLVPFLQKYKKQIIEARITGDIDKLLNTIGKNNFEELNDCINKVDYLIEEKNLKRYIEKEEENDITKEYDEQLKRLEKIYTNMELYASKEEER